MRFLANGDFNFPFDWSAYWVKHFYMWSFQSGAPNPDGIIRLPGRVLNFLVFGGLGHVTASYFYLFSTLLIAAVAFYVFCRHFLEVKNRGICLLGALFFAANPIFLGNLAKVGLVLAAAMLPLCLLAVKTSFQRQRLRYLLWAVLCLNISLIHPYTFSINFAVTAIYFLIMARRYWSFIMARRLSLLLITTVAVLLHAYLILPIWSMGTISKDVISSSAVKAPTDYTALVSVSNTGDILTGLSLSKNVFLDFSFYSEAYRPVYLLASTLLYVIILGLLVYVSRDLRSRDKLQVAMFCLAFLTLVALAATNFLQLDRLIKLLIGLPGGWAFRSPLKWQLYIPLALFGLLVLLLSKVEIRALRRMVTAGLLAVFVAMNGYLGYSVYHMLLVPRELNTFAALQHEQLDHRTLLFVNNLSCQKLLPYNSPLVTELNQIFTSVDVQMKRVWEDEAESLNLHSFDYVMTCRSIQLQQLIASYGFDVRHRFAGDAMLLYAADRPAPPVRALDTVYSMPNSSDLAGAYGFAQKRFGQAFDYVAEPAAPERVATGSSVLTEVFGGLGRDGLKPGLIQSRLTLPHGPATLYAQPGSKSLYYQLAKDRLTLGAQPAPGLVPLVAAHKPAQLPLPDARSLDVDYRDQDFAARNLIKNPSLEDGLWQKKVQDCFAHDAYPAIAMKQVAGDATDGRHALQLESANHIACTGPAGIAVKPGEQYLVSFDYRAFHGRAAGYYVSFDGAPRSPTPYRLLTTSTAWQHTSNIVTVPDHASRLRLVLYAYPTAVPQRAVVRYDNVGVFAMPDVRRRFYAVHKSDTALRRPDKLAYTIVDPTKKLVRLTGTRQPFYLADNDTYHALWSLRIGSVPAAAPHLSLNSLHNAWFIDPRSLCEKHAGDCQRNPDGSYNLTLSMVFVPQQRFYTGLIISSVTLAGCLLYLIFTWGIERRRR